MAWIVESKSINLPVTLSEAKDHLKVTNDQEDAMIQAMIQAATDMAEQFLNMSVVSQSIIEYLDCFPEDCVFLSRSPLIAVTELKYFPSDGGSDQTIESVSFIADKAHKPPRIQAISGWPATADRINAVSIKYTSGYADAASVPGTIKAAILLIVGDLYENREDRPKKMPDASKYLLRMHRVWRW